MAVVRRPGAHPARSTTLGLARIGGLCRQMRVAGVRSDLETTGTPRPLPDVVDLTGYRVIQESLTNVLRHSGATTA